MMGKLKWNTLKRPSYEYALGERGIWFDKMIEDQGIIIAHKNHIGFRIEINQETEKVKLEIYKKIETGNPYIKNTIVLFNDDQHKFFTNQDTAKSYAEEWFTEFTENPSIIDSAIKAMKESIRQEYHITSEEEVKDVVFKSGKHAGKSVISVWTEDKNYCMWYLANVNENASNSKVLDSLNMFFKRELCEKLGIDQDNKGLTEDEYIEMSQRLQVAEWNELSTFKKGY